MQPRVSDVLFNAVGRLQVRHKPAIAGERGYSCRANKKAFNRNDKNNFRFD